MASKKFEDYEALLRHCTKLKSVSDRLQAGGTLQSEEEVLRQECSNDMRILFVDSLITRVAKHFGLARPQGMLQVMTRPRRSSLHRFLLKKNLNSTDRSTVKYEQLIHKASSEKGVHREPGEYVCSSVEREHVIRMIPVLSEYAQEVIKLIKGCKLFKRYVWLRHQVPEGLQFEYTRGHTVSLVPMRVNTNGQLDCFYDADGNVIYRTDINREI